MNAVTLGAGTKALVTGGAGFVGSHLSQQLVDLGVQVSVLDDLSTGSEVNLVEVRDRIELVVGDLGEILRSGGLHLGAYDVVFHLAANPYIPPSVEDPVFDFRLNLENTLLLLESLRFSRKRPRLVLASSAAVYGNPCRQPIRETDLTMPISPYGVSKLGAERYAAVYSELYGLAATSLRLFSVYGPRQRKQVVYDLLVKLHCDCHRVQVLGDGSQARDFIYVSDVVRALILVASSAPCKGEVYNVASGQTYSIAQLLRMWCEIYEIDPEIVYAGAVRPGDAQVWAVDITRLKGLGFEAQTSIRSGLEAVRRWYEAEP